MNLVLNLLSTNSTWFLFLIMILLYQFFFCIDWFTSEPNLRAWRRWPPWLYLYLPIPWELSQFLFHFFGFCIYFGSVLLLIWLIAECWYVEKVSESEFEKAWAEFAPFWMVKYQSINCLVYELDWLGYRHTDLEL